MTTATAAPAQRFPLSWPTGWVRTPSHARKRAAFGKRVTRSGSTPDSSYTMSESLTIGDGLARLNGELRRLRVDNVIISSNLQTRGDGMPYSKQGKMLEDPGVAVYFKLKGAPRVLACDKWTSAADNMAAIAGHIEAIRMQDRYGVGTIEQAFAGYTALPASAVDWRIVLELEHVQRPTLDDVDEAVKRLARKHHPDRGGRHEDMARVTEARANAIKAIQS